MSVVIHCLDDRIFGKVLQENAGLYGVRFYCFDGQIISIIVKCGPVCYILI